MNALDRGRAALAAFVTLLTAKYDYAASYPSTVVYQNDDGTLELRPDASSVPGLSGVPIAYGVPGIRAKVKPGARVHVTFEDLDPSRPIATIFETDGIVELALDTDAASPRPIARMGDTLDIILLPAIPVMGTILAPTGALVSFTGVLVIPPLPAVGVILSGNPRVLG